MTDVTPTPSIDNCTSYEQGNGWYVLIFTLDGVVNNEGPMTPPVLLYNLERAAGGRSWITRKAGAVVHYSLRKTVVGYMLTVFAGGTKEEIAVSPNLITKLYNDTLNLTQAPALGN